MNKLFFEKWYRDERNEVKGITFKRDNDKRFEISFQGNLDLYFSFASLNGKEDYTFIIGKDNYQIWEIFDKLYNDVINCNLFEFTEEDRDKIISQAEALEEDYHENLRDEEERIKSINQDLRESERYTKLVQDGVITWKSDDYCYDVAPYFKIEKIGESYLITFGVPNISRKLNLEERMLVNDFKYLNLVSVRIRNSGSTYDLFNIVFMKAFNSLMGLEEINQIHIEEYLIDKELEQGENLERILRK